MKLETAPSPATDTIPALLNGSHNRWHVTKGHASFMMAMCHSALLKDPTVREAFRGAPIKDPNDKRLRDAMWRVGRVALESFREYCESPDARGTVRGNGRW